MTAMHATTSARCPARRKWITAAASAAPIPAAITVMWEHLEVSARRASRAGHLNSSSARPPPLPPPAFPAPHHRSLRLSTTPLPTDRPDAPSRCATERSVRDPVRRIARMHTSSVQTSDRWEGAERDGRAQPASCLRMRFSETDPSVPSCCAKNDTRSSSSCQRTSSSTASRATSGLPDAYAARARA